MNIYEKQAVIADELKSPKSQENKFGGFNYRNLEDILNNLKPLLVKYKCSLTFNNTLKEIQGKLFRESVALLVDCEKPDSFISSTMIVQERLQDKKMGPEQMSGSSASYADKYALNKLLLLDDAQDPDSINNEKTSEMPSRSNSNPSNLASSKQKQFIHSLMGNKKLEVTDMIKPVLTKLSADQASKLIVVLSNDKPLDQNQFELAVFNL